jgi:hypothetical protein
MFPSPALVRSVTNLISVLADDSAGCPRSKSDLTGAGAVASSNSAHPQRPRAKREIAPTWRMRVLFTDMTAKERNFVGGLCGGRLEV